LLKKSSQGQKAAFSTLKRHIANFGHLVKQDERTDGRWRKTDDGNSKKGKLFLIEGSNKTLEISLKNDSANEHLCMKTGEKIKIS
jgi:S-adenosylmethionine hydrolase